MLGPIHAVSGDRRQKPKYWSETYSAHGINDGGGSFGLLAIVEPGLLAHQSPQLVQVDGGAVGCVPLQVVMSHTHLTKVPRMAEDTQGGQMLNSMQFVTALLYDKSI